ncbi:hypothetical protein UCREL1_8049 [Eutypa lata UCREL1]|uniref:Umta methyltransferase family protein n=1 Tax=Eutypa lata (strain UCR-EL1) TaxID=1287681 RepID=M7SFD9_EUTLA|nr:hypothetical protein UCREL1_8049 [Eutypa lata UCREL1]
MHEKYDLVHVRLLVAAMLPDEWEPAVRNLVQLLKPGGFLQWEECDFVSAEHLKGNPSSRIDTAKHIADMFRAALWERFEHGWNELPEHMRAVGLASVTSDVMASDRVPETRKRMTASIMGLVFTWARVMTERGAPGSMSGDHLDHLEKEVHEEIKSGGYFKYNIHVACGRKALE